MRRREFILALGSVAAAWPLGALLIIAALVAAIPALAHSWFPLACFGNMDCVPAMYASGAAANTPRSARSSCRMCSRRSPACVGRTKIGGKWLEIFKEIAPEPNGRAGNHPVR